MNERQMQFRVGVVVFATMIIGTLLATLNAPLPTSWLPWGRTSYKIGILLPEAPGVAPNTPVRKNGILIGRVSEIEDLQDGVNVWAEIEGGRPLYPQYEPYVRTTVLGDATIDFSTRPVPPGTPPVADGTVYRGRVAPNPFDAIAKLGDLQDDIARTMDALTRAGDEVAVLAKRVNNAFGDETEQGRVSRLLDTTERAMTQFADTMTAFNEIFGDGSPSTTAPPNQLQRLPHGQPLNLREPSGTQPLASRAVQFQQPDRGQPPITQPQLLDDDPMSPIDGPMLRQRLRQGLNELPDAVRDTRAVMRQFSEVLDLADENLRNLKGVTEPLGQRGEQIADALIRSVDGVGRLVDDFNVLIQALNNREGTIGRLIHDPQTHENLNRLMVNANTVLGQFSQLAARLRPIVEDARVLMDKLAREPGRVITGGLNPSPIK